MAEAKLTLIGLFRFDNNLFSELSLPDGIDKDLFVDCLLLEKGELEVLYPDREFLKGAIGIWGRKWSRTFKKWIEALNIEYDPLYNYDRIEEWEDNSKGTNINTQTNDLTIHNTGNVDTEFDTEGSATDTGTNDMTVTEKVSAFNSSTFENKNQAITDQDTTNTNTHNDNGTNNEEHEDTTTNTGTIKDDGSDSRDSTHKGHLYGNIGVTTSQQMLEAELDIDMWNIYEKMSDIFSNELLIGVW